MTTEEAANLIETAIHEVEWDYPLEYAEAFEVAIDSMKKQIGKKVIYKLSDMDMYAECPCCTNRSDMFVYNWKSPFCQYCGQKLDWSKSND